MSDYFNLGNHTRTISASSPDAQLWFDRGLNWTYGFNHEEAVRCFERAAEADPGCAMAYWGIAYAAGPNYNKPWEYFDEIDLAETIAKTYAMTRHALTLLDGASPAERALIEALASRYQTPEPPEPFEVLASWNDAYADAMRAVYRDFGDDLDVAALAAEALMNRTPWQLWDQPTGAPAEGASTLEAKDMLERALATTASRTHPGVLHMYIHLMEMSPTPELALRPGDFLRGLVPDAGHLEHMPTHIDIQCGHYHAVIEWNQKAAVVDRKFVEREGVMNLYTMYRVHNVHFTLYGAMFLGQSEVALAAADQMVEMIPEDLLRVEVPPMAWWLEPFVPMKMHALIRFGKWQEIIDLPLPADQALYCTSTAMIHYAKSVALAATGRVMEAEAERERFDAAVARVPEAYQFQNTPMSDIFALAAAMLMGELEYRKGNHAVAFDHLRRAVYLEDNLPYAEPWAWMQPTRHALGALLLEQGHVDEAEAVYRADLGLDDSLPRSCQHPENVWALHGYHECLLRQGKHELAGMIRQRLDLAIARADVPIQASCFCRMSQAA
jgi:tetratricopeptide (TPR) repeat protein